MVSTVEERRAREEGGREGRREGGKKRDKCSKLPFGRLISSWIHLVT